MQFQITVILRVSDSTTNSMFILYQSQTSVCSQNKSLIYGL